MRPRFILLFSLLSFLLGAHSQTCEIFANNPPICSRHLPPSALISIPPGLDQRNLTDIAAPLLNDAALLPPACAYYAMRVACLLTFRVCAPDGLITPLCSSACSEYNDGCIATGIIPAYYSLNCTAEDSSLPGASLFSATAARNSSILCVTSFFFGQQWAGEPVGCNNVLNGNYLTCSPFILWEYCCASLASAVSACVAAALFFFSFVLLNRSRHANLYSPATYPGLSLCKHLFLRVPAWYKALFHTHPLSQSLLHSLFSTHGCHQPWRLSPVVKQLAPSHASPLSVLRPLMDWLARSAPPYATSITHYASILV